MFAESFEWRFSRRRKNWPDKLIRKGWEDAICTVWEKSVPEMVTERPCRKLTPQTGQKMFLSIGVTGSLEYRVSKELFGQNSARIGLEGQLKIALCLGLSCTVCSKNRAVLFAFSFILCLPFKGHNGFYKHSFHFKHKSHHRLFACIFIVTSMHVTCALQKCFITAI